MSFSTRVLLGLFLGAFAGLFFGELVAPLDVVARTFVRLLQMTVLPYVTLSITANLGALTYRQARSLGLRVGAVMALVWVTAILFAFLMPLTFPDIESASFYSPALAERADPFNFLDLYVPTNPFNALANSVVPAVVLFSVLLGLALIGIERKEPLLDVLHSGVATIGRIARFIVRLTPVGVFAIAAVAAGTLEVHQLERIQVYLIAYGVFAVVMALWVLPGLVGVLTPIGAVEGIAASRDALLTAFLVGDLFIVLPSLIESCSELVSRRIDASEDVRGLPNSIVPTSFTFPHAGKLLSLSFILFAGWFTDTIVPLARYPQLAMAGLVSLFGSLNVAIPFLLDLFRIPADTFQLFLATGVINQRLGTLVAAVHTIAIGLLGSAALAGRLEFRPARIARFATLTVVLMAVLIGTLRFGFARFPHLEIDGRSIVNAMQPLATEPVDDGGVLSAADVPADSIPEPSGVLANIRARQMLRVGLIDDGIPYAYRNDRQQVVGFDIEMAQQLALALGVGIEFVRFAQAELDDMVHRRVIDIVMTGARVTPERSASFATSEPYLDETLAIITLDYRRAQFQSWEAIRATPGIRLGVQPLQYYVGTIRELLPNAELVLIENTTELIDPDSPYAGYVLPAERGAVLTMLNPRFSVVIPDGARVGMPLAYPIAGEDEAWIRFVNTWIGMKKRDGFVDRLYDHWILGEEATQEGPRWSIVRDVLHWID